MRLNWVAAVLIARQSPLRGVIGIHQPGHGVGVCIRLPVKNMPHRGSRRSAPFCITG